MNKKQVYSYLQESRYKDNDFQLFNFQSAYYLSMR